MPQIISTIPRLEDVFDRANLHRLYKELKEAKYDHWQNVVRFPAGWDGVSLSRFEKQLEQHLAAIERKVLSSRYTFRPFLSKGIPKSDGGTRNIAFSGIRDRIVQAAMHEVIGPAVEAQLSQSAYAYRSGLSPHDAVCTIYESATNGRPWFCESDFRKFFDTLDHDRLLDLICELDIDERAKELCWRFARTGALAEDVESQSLPDARVLGVPQGGVVSGVLANLYLADFDRAVSEWGVQLVRYADDFVIHCSSPAECHEVWQFVQKATSALLLALHPDKTSVGRHLNDGLEFVGFHMRGTVVSVKKDNIARFKNRIAGVLNLVREKLDEGHYTSKNAALSAAIMRVNRKITGVDVDGKPRSWMRYFRLVNNTRQIQALDRWCWITIATFARQQGLGRLQRKDLKELGLRSLTQEYWNARRVLPTPYLESSGFIK